jgi:hypothetical protein
VDSGPGSSTAILFFNDTGMEGEDKIIPIHELAVS